MSIFPKLIYRFDKILLWLGAQPSILDAPTQKFIDVGANDTQAQIDVK